VAGMDFALEGEEFESSEGFEGPLSRMTPDELVAILLEESINLEGYGEVLDVRLVLSMGETKELIVKELKLVLNRYLKDKSDFERIIENQRSKGSKVWCLVVKEGVFNEMRSYYTTCKGMIESGRLNRDVIGTIEGIVKVIENLDNLIIEYKKLCDADEKEKILSGFEDIIISVLYKYYIMGELDVNSIYSIISELY